MDLPVAVRPERPLPPAPPSAALDRRTGRLPRLALAAVAGLALYAAFPPVGLWPAAVLGVALLAVAVHGAGVRTGALDVGPVRLGDVICFEVAYDDLVRDTVQAGGRLLVVQTNNATFGRSPQTEQQLAMSRLRAVEHRRAVVVAATSGVSAVVRPGGSLAHRAEVFTRDVAVTGVPVSDARTPATRLGGWPELAVSLLGAGAVLVALRCRPETAVTA